MTIAAPQIAFITLMALSFGFTVAKHGEPKTGRHNMGWALVAVGIELVIVYWGGFFG